MTHPRPQRPNTIVEWLKTMGIVSGALIATGTVLHWLGVNAYSATMQPVRRELADSTSAIHRSIRREREERRRMDDSVITVIRTQHAETMGELHDIRALLVRGMTRGTP